MFILSKGMTPFRATWNNPVNPHDGKWCEDDGLPRCRGCHGRSRIRDVEGDHLKIIAERMGSGICGICGPVLIEWIEVQLEGERDVWYGRATPV